MNDATLISIEKLFPPAAEVGGRIDVATHERIFEKSWFELQRRFFKLETRQFYDETGTPAYDAWQRGDVVAMKRLAKERISEQGEIYSFMQKKGFKFIRVRVLKLPVTDYVRFENEVYCHLAQAGETILGIIHDTLPEDLHRLMDFLLFDNVRVLVHDYDDHGARRGSWLVEEPHVHAYETVAVRLLAVAQPWEIIADKYL